MTTDGLNIANGNAQALLLKHQGKNLFGFEKKFTSNPDLKTEQSISSTVKSTSAKSLTEVNKSFLPLNKPIESNQNSVKGFLNSDVLSRSGVLPETNFNENSFQSSEINYAHPENITSTQIEQRGWFITIVPDRRINMNYLQLTERKDDRKEKLKDFYSPIVKFNKGKLLDIVG